MPEVPRVAFTLQEDAEGFSGGSVAVADGETLDVAERLEEGDGQIVVDEGSVEDRALSGFAGPLEREQAEPRAEGEEPEAPAATPAAERIASELGVDLAEVDGSGAGGKITADDVKEAAGPETAGNADNGGDA